MLADLFGFPISRQHAKLSNSSNENVKYFCIMRGKHHICLMNGVSLLSYERDVRIICKNKRYMYMVRTV